MHKHTLGSRCLSSILAVLLGLQGIPAGAFGSPGVEPRADGYTGEALPVDLRTGALVLATQDLRVGHDRLPLALGRVYRSDMDQSEPGLFGNKWHSILDMRIVREGETLAVRDEQGRPRTYTPSGDGLWISKKHDYEAIRRNADGKWERHLKSGVVYRFDGDGRLAEIADPNGRFIRITRLESAASPDGDEQQSIRLEDRYGRHITVVLGENGRVLTASDSVGRRCVYLHDESGNLKAFINHAGGAVAMTYNDAHRLTELNGAVVYTLTYGKDGRIASQSTERGNIARYDYTLSADGAIACRVTDATGGVSCVAFAADGQVTITDPTGVAENVWMNERELPVKVAGADGQTVEIRYDERANPVEIIRDGVATRLRHGLDNTLTTVESDTGTSLTFAYDARRNVTAVENQNGARSVFTWDRHGLLRSAKSPTGPSVALDYDAHGQVSAIRTGDGQTIALNFDTQGLLRQLTTPTGVDFRYAYDLAGHLTSVENSEGQRVRLERDAQGRVVRVLDAAGNLTRMDYDPAGLLTLVRDPVGAATRLDYDALGRPEAYTDSNENVTRWTYDAAGRLLGEVDALGEAATLAYDAQGRLSRQVNRRGQATAIRYDAAGRVAGVEQAAEPASFAYDAYGRAIGMSNPDSDFAFSLTPDGLIKRVTDRKAGLAVAYEYDQAGRRIGMTAGDETVRYAYDAHGRLRGIESSAGRIGFEYDAYGRRSVMQYPNGVRTTYTYDRLNRIVEIRAIAADGRDVSRYRYTYDLLGNRIQMIEGENRYVNYTYDAANRLVRVAEVDQVTEYIYDDVGNRASVIINGRQENWFTGKDNRLLKAGDAEFEYDADGNMTARTTADGQRYAYRYDAANRLIEAEGLDGTVAYAYAPNGARVTRTEDGQTTRFVFDHEDVVFEVVDGKIAARYLHGPGIDEPLALKRGEDIAFYHTDALGSVHRLSGPDGNPVGRYSYDAFGRLIETESAIANTTTYTGREWDSSADAYFYRARFFIPDVGRFSARDPLGLTQGANQYAYVANNPMAFTDPFGTYGVDNLIYGFEGGIEMLLGVLGVSGNVLMAIPCTLAAVVAGGGGLLAYGVGSFTGNELTKQVAERVMQDSKAVFFMPLSKVTGDVERIIRGTVNLANLHPAMATMDMIGVFDLGYSSFTIELFGFNKDMAKNMATSEDAFKVYDIIFEVAKFVNSIAKTATEAVIANNDTYARALANGDLDKVGSTLEFAWSSDGVRQIIINAIAQKGLEKLITESGKFMVDSLRADLDGDGKHSLDDILKGVNGIIADKDGDGWPDILDFDDNNNGIPNGQDPEFWERYGEVIKRSWLKPIPDYTGLPAPGCSPESTTSDTSDADEPRQDTPRPDTPRPETPRPVVPSLPR